VLQKIKPQWERLISPICIVFEKSNISPNWITVLSTLFISASGICYGLREFYWAVGVGLIGGIFDGVDGKVARDLGKTSQFGGFFDSTMDRVAEIFIGGGIIYSFLNTPDFVFAAFATFISMNGAIMTSYVRARAQGVGVDTTGGILQRADRGLFLGISAIISHKALLYAVCIVGALSYITVLQRIIQVYKKTKSNP